MKKCLINNFSTYKMIFITCHLTIFLTFLSDFKLLLSTYQRYILYVYLYNFVNKNVVTYFNYIYMVV